MTQPNPRITKAFLESIIVDKQFHRLAGTLTVCTLTLRNGFIITGESACVSAEMYDQAMGEKVAFDNAFSKLWQLEGYVLKNTLAGYSS